MDGLSLLHWATSACVYQKQPSLLGVLETHAMTPRARLEAVLKKHAGAVRQFCDYPNLTEQWDLLLTDLLACWTPPSREALAKLLDAHFVVTDHHVTLPAVPCRYQHGAVNTALLDALLAWASGERKPEWCAHIRWSHRAWVMCRTWDTSGSASWAVNDAEWFCRFCAAPRPSEAE